MDRFENDKEKMCIYLLRKYPEIKYMDINPRMLYAMGKMKENTIDEAVRYMENEKRCVRLALRKLGRQREDWEASLIENMEQARNRLELRGRERDCSAVDILYFSRRVAFQNVKQQKNELGIEGTRFYSERLNAERAFATQIDDCIDIEQIYQRVWCRLEHHEPSGVYYRDAEKLLKKYRKIKYAIINDMLNDDNSGKKMNVRERIDYIDNFRGQSRISGWMESSMLENTFAEILLIEEAVRQMRYFGSEGREYCELLTAVFIEGEGDGYIDLKIAALGLTQRTFYQRRKKAITMFSKLIWGPLGHRHSFNPYS